MSLLRNILQICLSFCLLTGVAIAEQPIGFLYLATKASASIYIQGVAHAVKKGQDNLHPTVKKAIQESDRLLAENQSGVLHGDAPLSKLLTISIDYRKSPWKLSENSRGILSELVVNGNLPIDIFEKIQSQPPLWLPDVMGRELTARHPKTKLAFLEYVSKFETTALMPSIKFAKSINKNFHAIEVNGTAFGFWDLNCKSNYYQEQYVKDLAKSALDFSVLNLAYKDSYDYIYFGDEKNYVNRLSLLLKKYPSLDFDNVCHNVNRNNEWAEYLSRVAAVEGSKRLFVMVGVGHIFPIKSRKNNSLILELEKNGFNVVRVK